MSKRNSSNVAQWTRVKTRNSSSSSINFPLLPSIFSKFNQKNKEKRRSGLTGTGLTQLTKYLVLSLGSVACDCLIRLLVPHQQIIYQSRDPKIDNKGKYFGQKRPPWCRINSTWKKTGKKFSQRKIMLSSNKPVSFNAGFRGGVKS